MKIARSLRPIRIKEDNWMGLWKGIEFELDNQSRGWRWRTGRAEKWSRYYRTKWSAEKALFAKLDKIQEEILNAQTTNEQTQKQTKLH